MCVDVLVVGGGPAGSASAIALSTSGLSVLLIDKAVFPRPKCCGDGITTLALRELERIGFSTTSVADWFDVDKAILRAPSGLTVELPLPPTGLYAAIAPRTQLDHALLQLAIEAGVDVREGTAFSAIDVSDPERIAVTVDGIGVVSARFVIAADGVWSATRKAVGANTAGYLGEWHAFRQYARNITGIAASQLIVWFDPDLLPGYAWSFPLPGNRVNIGFGVLRDGGRRVQDMAALWADILTREHVVDALGSGFELEGRHTAWPIPARIDQVELAVGRVLFVGDAAAAADVLTGEGIGQALLTGRLAAEAIIADASVGPDRVAAQYRKTASKHLFADHRMSRRLGVVLKHRNGANLAIRIVTASGPWGRRNFARWMFEDEPRAILTSPRRWHRRIFRSAGAFRSQSD